MAFIKAYHAFRFREFLNLLTNNKYIIIFNKRERSGVFFTTSLLLVQWAILSIAIWRIISFFRLEISFYAVPEQYLIMIGVALFILLKIAFQRLISYVFDMDTFSRSYLFVRLSYSNYAALILVLLLFVNIYAMELNIYMFAFSLIVFLYIQVLGLVSFAKLYKQSENSPYHQIIEKYKVKIDFRPFTEVQGVTGKDLRAQKIELQNHTAIILTSKNAVDHFFRVAEEMRFKVPDTMRYFCLSEAIAFYLQKYITYRKRKIYVGKKDFADLLPFLKKHKEEKFFFPTSEVLSPVIEKSLDDLKLNWKRGILFKTAHADISDLKDVKYDVIAFFSPAGVESLFKNFSDFKQGTTRIAVFGASTLKSAEEAGLKIDIQAPLPDTPSMTMALDKYLEKANKR